jgi:hypothetical protein
MPTRALVHGTVVLWATLACMSCRGSTTSANDPLALDRDPAALERVAVRILGNELVSASPGGPNLLDGSAGSPWDQPFDAKLIERSEGWVRLEVVESQLRLALWVPAEQVELAVPDPNYVTFNIAPTWMDASWVEVDRGTRLLDGPNGTAFGVMLEDGPLLWCGGRSEDGFVEVCVRTNWGYLRAYVTCPCQTVRGAGG